MTIEEVKKRIDEIKMKAHDDEAAHGMEDSLREEVLEAIAFGAHNAKELAKIVLTTSEIEFSRWCA